MSEIFEFANFQLDVRERVLLRTPDGDRVALPEKAFDTLCILVRNAGRLVAKEELLSSVWAGSFVEENNLNKSVHAIRRALDEKNGDQKYIETVKKHGFRFVAEVKPIVRQRELVEGSNGDLKPKRPHATIHEFPHLVARTEPQTALALAAEPEPVDEHISAEPNLETILTPVRPTDSLPIVEKAARWRNPPLYLAVAAILLLVLVVTGSLAYRYASTGTVSALSGPSTIAVLPLKPVNAEKRDFGLEMAVADSLILKLNDTKDFRVSRLSAVRQFAEIDVDPVESGRQLGVDYVLASNYQMADGRIRVTSQLLNVGTGATEKTFKCESATGDIFEMQDAVANEIGNAVLENFGKPKSTYASSRGTQNEEAVNLFYEAFYLVDKNNKDDSAKAADLLGQAVLLDPNYAQAWALRAQAYCQFAHRGGGKPDQVFTIAEPMLEKALLLDRDNSTALLVKGIIDRDYHWKFDDAYLNLRRAINADPNSWFAHRELGVLCHHDGRFGEAAEELKKALELNPTSVANRWLLGLNQIDAGQRDEGIAQLKRVIEMDPSFLAPYDTLWQLYNSEGDGPNAYSNFIKVKELYGTKPEHMAHLRSAYFKGGWQAVLRAEFDELRSQDPKGEYSGSKYYIATIAALVGDRDAAFEYLEQAMRFRLIGISWIKVDHRLDPLRDDPRFQDILRRSGLLQS